MPRDEMPIPNFADSIPKQWIDAEYALQPREILSLDETLQQVVRAVAITQKYLPTVKIPPGSRSHELLVVQELAEPIFDDDFLTEELDYVRKVPVEYFLLAMHKDFRLNMIDIDASRNQRYYNTDIQTLNIQEATLSVADYKERANIRGYDILNKAKTAVQGQGIIDSRVGGLITPPAAAGSLNSFAAAGDNAGMDSAGDGPKSVGAAMDSLIAKLFYGPYVFWMTPDIYGRIGLNFNATTLQSDTERMKGLTDKNGTKILEAMDVTPYLINKASVADNGSMLMFQRKTPAGQPTAVVGEAYPISHHPIQMNPFGIKGKVISMSACMNVRPTAFTLETDVNLIA